MKLYNEDCIKQMWMMIDAGEQADSIVTDPPYELGFMGKSWDLTGIAFQKETWELALQLLKPGGYLLAFGGSRTYHRMAVAIEDAGFEIRDQIMWLYGSGFPKSLNIGKAVDKLRGNQGKVVGQKKLWGANASGGRGGQNSNEYQPTKKGSVKYEEIRKVENEWEGWGTALKPAHEPIVMARKPVEGTVTKNVLKHGTGGINIDECRISTNDITQRENRGVEWGVRNDKSGNEFEVYGSTKGRFPANVLHDGSEEVMQGFPDSKGCQPHTITSNIEKHEGWGTITQKSGEMVGYNDDGSAARFFYCAKVSRKERNRGLDNAADAYKSIGGNYSQSPVCETCDKTLNGTNDHTKCTGKVYYRKMQSEITKNNHPTVKPLELMKYLCRLVTPKGGTVLDPFMGSGSTGMAAKDEGFKFIGIEKEKEYYEIAEQRIKAIAPLLEFMNHGLPRESKK
jgi:site-specific DNA-methyltransferase (adenine-specific)